MKKGLVLIVLLVGTINFTVQAQSTASGSSNTGNESAGTTPAQNGSVGSTVSKSKTVPQNGSSMKGQSTGRPERQSSITASVGSPSAGTSKKGMKSKSKPK